jgi:hypothetical protein
MCNDIIVYDSGIVDVITSLNVPVLKTISYPRNERHTSEVGLDSPSKYHHVKYLYFRRRVGRETKE